MKLLFATEDYQYLADEILACDESAAIQGSIKRKRFPDGEKGLQINCHVDQAHCVILSGTQTTDNILEIYNLGYSMVASGAKKLTIIVPYYGYSTMERATKPGEVVTAKTMASLLSTIPKASYGNEIVLVELHTEAITHYFDRDLTARHLNSKDVVMRACVEMARTNNFVLATTDVGRAKSVEYLVKSFGVKSRSYNVEAAFVYKRRDSGTDTEVTGVNADVVGKTVVIYDDMVRTGGSLIKAAKIYIDHGAAAVYAVTTHGVLPGDSIQRIHDSGYIQGLAMTNSHPGALKAAAEAPNFVHLYSIAGMLSKYA